MNRNDRKKIVVYAQEIGGGNIVALVVQDLLALNLYKLEVVIHRHAEESFKGMKIPYRFLNDFGYDLPLSEIDAMDMLKSFNADYLFGAIGNVTLDKSNGNLFAAARKMNIKSLAAFDCWQGWDRFHDGKIRFVYAPDILVVIDEYSRKRMTNEGLDQNRIAVGGHPVLDKTRESFAEDITETEKSTLRERYGIGGQDCLVVLASQMINYKVEQKTRRIPFYAIETPEGKIIDRVLRALEDINKKLDDKSAVLMLRLHAKEDIAEGLFCKKSTVRVVVDRSISRFDLYRMADCIIGYDTMMLAEAVNAGCMVISLQFHGINHTFERNLVELAGGEIFTAENENDLIRILLDNQFYRKQQKKADTFSPYDTTKKKPSYTDILCREFPVK